MPTHEGIPARVDQIVYFGTDTHYRLQLDTGEPFTVRLQNAPGAEIPLSQGDQVGLAFAQGAVQVMRD